LHNAYGLPSNMTWRSLGVGVANRSLDFMLRRRRRDGVATSLNSAEARLLRRLEGVLAGLASPIIVSSTECSSRAPEAAEVWATATLLLPTGVAGVLAIKLLCLLSMGLPGGGRLRRRALLQPPMLLRLRKAGLLVRSSTERARLLRFCTVPGVLQPPMLLRRPVLGVPGVAMGVRPAKDERLGVPEKAPGVSGWPGKDERLRGRCGVTAEDKGFSMTSLCHEPKSSYRAIILSRAALSLSFGASTREVVQLWRNT